MKWRNIVLAGVLALCTIPSVGSCSCAAANKVAVYTENGLRAGEQAWDGHYRTKAEHCEKLHEPETPEMEECFGKTYDANEKVGTAIQSAVALLRAYWTARAAGDQPDWGKVIEEVQKIIDDLPPEAKAYFDKVRGL
jgi:hypothetical protein